MGKICGRRYLIQISLKAFKLVKLNYCCNWCYFRLSECFFLQLQHYQLKMVVALVGILDDRQRILPNYDLGYRTSKLIMEYQVWVKKLNILLSRVHRRFCNWRRRIRQCHTSSQYDYSKRKFQSPGDNNNVQLLIGYKRKWVKLKKGFWEALTLLIMAVHFIGFLEPCHLPINRWVLVLTYWRVVLLEAAVEEGVMGAGELWCHLSSWRVPTLWSSLAFLSL